jgi:hypothetical protein
MLIYNQADKASVDRAIARARKLKPRAKVLGYGLFSVSSSKPGVRYEVRFTADNLGQLVVSCQCQGNREFGRVCLHAASVAGLYKQQWSEKRAAQAAPPVRYCGCGLPVAGLSSYCQEHIATMTALYSDLIANMEG